MAVNYEVTDGPNKLDEGTLTEGGGLSTVDLLIRVACLAKNVNNNINIKTRRSKVY
jgi:hypothetical protein